MTQNAESGAWSDGMNERDQLRDLILMLRDRDDSIAAALALLDSFDPPYADARTRNLISDLRLVLTTRTHNDGSGVCSACGAQHCECDPEAVEWRMQKGTE